MEKRRQVPAVHGRGLALAAQFAGLDTRQNRGQYGAVIYLDHNATSPLLPQARAAWLEAEDRFPGNPSSPHRLGARSEAALEDARRKVATMLGCSPFEVVWTSGATEACNMVLQHVAANLDRRGGARGARGAGEKGRSGEEGADPASVWLSAIEHPAVLETARSLWGERLQLIPVLRTGEVDVNWLEARLRRERPALVALMAANNETGVLQPWQTAQRLCAKHGVPFFCDATQWCGRMSGAGLGTCDFVAGSAHKFGGPRGVGFLKCGNRGDGSSSFRPLLRGGKQQDGRRAGTENVSGVLAMVAAWEWCEEQIASGAVAERLAVRAEFESALTNAFPGATVNGMGAKRLWNTVSVVMPETEVRQRWVVKLDKAGFAVSTGSACASGSERPSHVLSAMAVTPSESARALRFSAGWLTPREHWDALLKGLVSIREQRVAPAKTNLPSR